MKIDWDLIAFPFHDKRWAGKFAIGAGLALVATYLWFPFFWLYLPIAGYGLRIMRQTARGEQAALPEWDNWGELFGDGLRVIVVGFVYLLPVLALVACAYAGLFGAMFTFPAMAAGSPRTAGPAALTMFVGMYGLFFLALALTFLLGIPLGLLAGGATTRLAATGSLGQAFEVRQVWSLLRRGFKHYIIAYLVLFGVAMGVSLAVQISIYTVILCCLYPFLQAMAVFYIQAEYGALFGMAYHETEHPDSPPASPPAPSLPPAPAPKLKDTDPTIKTDPLLVKAAAPSAPPASDGPATDEVPLVRPSDLAQPAAEPPANLLDRVRAANQDEAATMKIPPVSPADVTQASDAPPPAEAAPSAEPPASEPAADQPAPKKRRVSAPRKKKSTGGEGGA